MIEKKLTCCLIDDDRMSLKILQSLVEKTDFLQLSGLFENPIDASQSLSIQGVDLIFLDVEMPDMTGLELLESLDRKPQVILTTSKAQYAVDAFDYEVADFLLKPIHNYARFLKAARKAKANHEKSEKFLENNKINGDPHNKNQIFIKIDSLLVNFNLEHILWIEANGDYVKIHTDNKPILVHSKLRTVEENLPSHDFARVHRSYLVRLDKIKNIDNGNLQIGNKIIPVSSSYRSNLMGKIRTLN